MKELAMILGVLLATIAFVCFLGMAVAPFILKEKEDFHAKSE